MGAVMKGRVSSLQSCSAGRVHSLAGCAGRFGWLVAGERLYLVDSCPTSAVRLSLPQQRLQLAVAHPTQRADSLLSTVHGRQPPLVHLRLAPCVGLLDQCGPCGQAALSADPLNLRPPNETDGVAMADSGQAPLIWSTFQIRPHVGPHFGPVITASLTSELRTAFQ